MRASKDDPQYLSAGEAGWMPAQAKGPDHSLVTCSCHGGRAYVVCFMARARLRTCLVTGVTR